MQNEVNFKNYENMEVTNKLLLEMLKNQKSANKNLTKTFIAVIICYTVLLLGMVIGFFVYESQFEIIDGEYETYEYQQEGTGDEVNFNNVSGDQYNDNSTHNEN